MLSNIINKSNSVLKFSKNCRACGSKKVFKAITLKPTPFEDHFITNKELNIKQKKYPLVLYLCKSCKYLYLSHILNPKFSYKYYLYNTEITLGLEKFYKNNVNFIIKKLKLNKKDTVLDIGSNDGTFLKYFKKRKINVVGIEPAVNVCKKAKKKGIKTINSFFNDKLVNRLKRNLSPSLISANYVFANIEDINNFIDNILKILKQDGTLAINTGYHPTQFKKNMFDYIYHEHYSYFSLSFLKIFFEKKGLDIIYAEKTIPKLGSIFLLVKRKNNNLKSKFISKLINEEKKMGLNELGYFKKFKKRIDKIGEETIKVLKSIKNKNMKLIGYGASHSTTILIHQFGLNKFLDFIVDDNKIKQGLFSPGFHIPVFKGEKIYENFKNSVIVLAWQHQNKIIKKNKKYLKNGGKFIIPLPYLKVIKNK